MRREPIVTPDARADILDAGRLYEAERNGLGFQFLDEFEHASSLIQGFKRIRCSSRWSTIRFVGLSYERFHSVFSTSPAPSAT